MKKKSKKNSEIIQHICFYDGHTPYGICMYNQCQYKGFICILCWLLYHMNHLNYTFPQIEARVKLIIRLIKQIAFQFSLSGNEDYSEYLDNFTQKLWLLELNQTEYKSNKLQKEITLIQNIRILRQIKKQVTLSQEYHEYYFNQIKQLLFSHSKISRDHIQKNNISINLMTKILLFCILIVILLKIILVFKLKDM
ncbi:unnamed protein product [Paramecium primaurelia]|uniref:Transmembrane protein n=1 Tax=Paramecium primaurelia TaxID=5886 RepID=A0A8S1PP84_PARPR|nr:unnamed protein product [Paramecium primaurelia]